MAVDFVAASAAVGVRWGSSSSSLPSTAAAKCDHVNLNTWSAYTCNALMSGLSADTMYFYQVGSVQEGWSAVYNFTNEPAYNPSTGPRVAVYADFGLSNDRSLPSLLSAAAEGAFDYVIHAGDFAYDLDSDNSATGNSFMNSITPYAARFPYMGSPGNHEAYGTQGGGAFNQFNARFAGLGAHVGKNSGSNSSTYYSWELPGYAHFIAFTAETWTMSASQIAAQVAWMKADLAAVDRSRTPWVISYAHKFWSMDQVDWSDFDAILTEGGVDLHFCGHWHYYGRFFPLSSATGKLQVDTAASSADNQTYTNPKFPVGIVTGAPGNREVNPARCPLPAGAAPVNANSCNYGYGILNLVNASHAHWVWSTTSPVSGGVNPTYVDDFWLVQSSHGRRSLQ